MKQQASSSTGDMRMKQRDFDGLLEEHATILANIEESHELIKKSLDEIRSQSFELGQILGRLMEIRKLSLKTDAQVSRAGELLTLSSFVDAVLVEKNKSRAA